MTPRVALVNDRMRLACRSPEQAVKEAVDFPKAKGLVPSHRLAPRIMVAYAEIRDLPVRGNQSIRRPVVIFQKVPTPRQILLLAGIFTVEMRGWLRMNGYAHTSFRLLAR
jgi:hypothetical protein